MVAIAALKPLAALVCSHWDVAGGRWDPVASGCSHREVACGRWDPAAAPWLGFLGAEPWMGFLGAASGFMACPSLRCVGSKNMAGGSRSGPVCANYRFAPAGFEQRVCTRLDIIVTGGGKTKRSIVCKCCL